MGLPVRHPDERYTYGDCLTWLKDTRYELIDGVACAMTGPNRRHREITVNLSLQIAPALEGHTCRVSIAPFDVRLPKADEPNERVGTVVQPDVSVFCDSSRLDEQGARGAPEWVIEVLSPATAGHDQFLKRRAYARAGVCEYWLVHPTDRILTVYWLTDGVYGRPDVYGLTGTTPSRVQPAVVIDWDRIWRDLD